jgi:hypothetical protein
MATTTARAGLRKPGTSDFVTVGTDIDDNMDQIDEHLGALVCTSSTRPTGVDRFTGCIIYETDTLQYLNWDGANWQYIGGHFTGTWTVVITGSTSGTATPGNAVITREYHRNGRWVEATVEYVYGSTTSFGVVGALLIALPVNTVWGNGTPIGSGSIVDASTNDRWVVSAQVEDASRLAMIVTRTGTGVVSSSVPVSPWATGDTIRLNIRYRVA